MFSWQGSNAPDFGDRVRILRILGEIGGRLVPVRAFALQALRRAGLHSGRNRQASAAAILQAIHADLVWAREVGEQFYRPDRTLSMGGGDCDDLACLLYACLRAIGVPTEELEFRFLRDGASYTHVWVIVYLPALRTWYHLEPSVYGIQAGSSPLPLVRRAQRIV